MSGKYDVIVAGVGTMGSATCIYLAQKGMKVLGIEQYDIPNDLASHSGYTRIIRKAYYEHPDYVPLLLRSYDLWKELETLVNKKLYHETGILYLGNAGSPVLQGCLHSSKLYQIPVETWSRAETIRKFPQFQYPEGWVSLWEPEAGYLNVNESILSFYLAALNAGAQIITNEKVINWTQNSSGIEVTTGKDRYYADKIIFTSGAWTQEHFSSIALPLKVTRQTLAWLELANLNDYSSPQFPCWFLHDPEKGMYYGFPDSAIMDRNEPSGIKLALHVQGDQSLPSNLDRIIKHSDEAIINHFCEQYLPQGKAAPRVYKTCMYTNTPDEHFILDYLPNSDQRVILACGFSGHGFKFAPVIAELICSMTTGNASGLNIDFLRFSRFN